MQAAQKAEFQDVGSGQGAETPTSAVEGRGQKVRAMLKVQLGDEVYSSWFKSLEFESFDGRIVKVSVPVKFVRNWIQEHYSDHLLHCSRIEFATVERVEVVWRQPGAVAQRPGEARSHDANNAATAATPPPARPHRIFHSVPPLCALRCFRCRGLRQAASKVRRSTRAIRSTASSSAPRTAWRTRARRKLPKRFFRAQPGYNPLYIHSQVGLGKSHLLHAIAWEVKKRAPNAQVLYLTAERFRYQFVEALRSSDPLAFKERFRNIHMLLIDDLEFLQGERTEQEFDHIINALLDGGKQVVVASARAPNQIERLNERMRSRLQRGLVTELNRSITSCGSRCSTSGWPRSARLIRRSRCRGTSIDLLALRLTENGRELEGAVTRLYATWQYMRTPITLDIAETVIRDLVQNLEPRRIKIEDILRIISRHYGVSKGDLLSQRRHRSVVWPRQIGMYLAKHLTARSLPEIGRRFGGRDHTTVLHAIRKIEGEISKNPNLEDELEELKRLLNH